MWSSIKRWYQEQQNAMSERARQRQRQRQEEERERERQRQLQIQADEEELRRWLVLQQKTLETLRSGKVPYFPWIDTSALPFKLDSHEKWLFYLQNIEHAEVTIEREIEGMTSGIGVGVTDDIYATSGDFHATHTERDVLTSRGRGVFAISTKHLFFSGTRPFRVPIGRIVLARAVPEMKGLEIVRDRPNAMPEYFRMVRGEAKFAVELIHLLPNVDFGRGEPVMVDLSAFQHTP